MAKPTYDLHTLGWRSFQDLCLAVTRSILGQTVQSFLDSHDGGRDGAFTGIWQQQKGESLSGRFVIQWKFTSKPHENLTLSRLSEDFEKAQRLASDGRCDCYILLTNAGISGTLDEDIGNRLKDIGINSYEAYGADWIREQIVASAKLRAMVPRVYGLGDLSQILDARANDQTRAILQSLQSDLEKLVNTDAYSKAISTLQEHSLVILLGAPASGKTTIASQLTMAALDEMAAQTFKLDHPTDLRKHWNVHEKHQFFYIDDAFGTTQYRADLAEAWNRQLPHLRTILANGSKVVLTSRDYIFRRAVTDLKSNELPLLRDAEVVINVQDLSLIEKEQMLYNHIKLGAQPRAWRRSIMPLLPDVAANPHFMPELARRLGNPDFTRALELNPHSLRKFIDEPESFLEDTINDLDDDSRAALVLLFMHGGMLDSRLNLDSSSLQALSRLNSSLGGCRAALMAMEGGLVISKPPPAGPRWEFKHPTLSDATSAYLQKRPDLVDILVEGSDLERLMAQVTCGDVGLENAVVIPDSMFSEMVTKVHEALHGASRPTLQKKTVANRRLAHIFLARRCSIKFLQLLLEKYPIALDTIAVSVGYLGSDPSTMLASRLFDCGLLPESKRAAIVEDVVSAAISEYGFWEVDIASIKSGHFAKLVAPTELEDLEDRLRTTIIPLIDDVRESWVSDYDGEDPDGYLEPLQSYCHSAKQFFQDDWEIVQEMESQEAWMDDWFSDHYEENPMDDWKAWAEREDKPIENSQRSIFDDIDE